MKELITVKEIKEQCMLIFDAEDDIVLYVQVLNRVKALYPNEKFNQVATYNDTTISRMREYYMVNHLGMLSLWKLKEKDSVHTVNNPIEHIEEPHKVEPKSCKMYIGEGLTI